jgi:hypothetical protein
MALSITPATTQNPVPDVFDPQLCVGSITAEIQSAINAKVFNTLCYFRYLLFSIDTLV